MKRNNITLGDLKIFCDVNNIKYDFIKEVGTSRRRCIYLMVSENYIEADKLLSKTFLNYITTEGKNRMEFAIPVKKKYNLQ